MVNHLAAGKTANKLTTKTINMKAVKVSYARVYSLPNYQNEKISIEIEVQDGEKASEVLTACRKWCDSQSLSNNDKANYEKLKEIVGNPDNYTGLQVKQAKAELANIEDEELPF